MTAIIKIDMRSKATKSFLAYAKTIAFVDVEHKIYCHQELTENIKRAEIEKLKKMTTAQRLWENL